MTRVRCPRCGFVFSVEDIHRPVRCPNCLALLLELKDMMGDER